MAHIAACLVDSDGETSSIRSYIANTFSAQTSTDSLSSISSVEEKKPFTWRMHNPEARKYQLFPKEKPLPTVTAGKQLEAEPTSAMAVSQSPDKADREKPSLSSGLRMRIKEHNLTRRRKVSVPELGPMTTVQEVAMDSPTIPGRPAVHERSISSPANTMRHHQLAASTSYFTRENIDTNKEASLGAQPSRMNGLNASPSKHQLSPRDLAPLTIPNHSTTLPGLARKISLSRLRAGKDKELQDSSMRSGRTEDSPKTRTPYTPQSATMWSATPKSTTTAMTTSTLPTPISASAETRSSPTPWDKPRAMTPTSQANMDSTSTPKAEGEAHKRSASATSHSRNQSESGSIMERGRPRKKFDGTPIGCGLKRTDSKRSVSADRRAFETLPQGWKPSEAGSNLDQAEVTYLQKQALGQALRFEILRKDDVESLSKELRHLDERTEYLRRTYTSLRAGRRNLHTRICQYLRSPRVAKFSYESMLKQEEALAELDSSIDDWVNKLDQAENRRTRVRQKLLEHVAAAATLASSDVAAVSETLQQAMGVRTSGDGTTDLSTPPRSPTKNAPAFHCVSPTQSPSPSPQRVVARVPSAIPEMPAEESSECGDALSRKSAYPESTLGRMESIRIYADSDVYALLADVENEFTKLNGDAASPEILRRRSKNEDHVMKAVHRTRSHDLLNGNAMSGPSGLDKNTPLSPPAPSPPMKNSPTDDGDVFLSATVFQPYPTAVGA
ncbi:hypothetical protein F5Y15DRAFT_413921 [Xylariaceae sp. FL0016]|nr:hypothetical protein F5Y15DRAFT_413921 [Xylariaceae sp. FL0016]